MVDPIPLTTMFPQIVLTRMQRQIRRWSAKHGRDLPWTGDRDPYRVWLREIMLQQTTVAAVVPYFERFLSRFPTVADLAAADETEILRLWEGLGYYSRARNIHKTAKVIVQQYGGEFSSDVATLMSLPGIGRYTAGAIASFAFGIRAPIVEANTLRLYCRLLGFDGDPRSSRGQQRLWEFAEHILPRRGIGAFNQALMDLGATVCVPSEPKCDGCPLHDHCLAFRSGRQTVIPALPQRRRMTEVVEASVAVHKDGAYLLRQRSESERWAGLWDFPRFPVNANASDPSTLLDQLSVREAQELSDDVRRLTGISIQAPVLLTTFKHTVTRYRITLRCLHAEYSSGRLSSPSAALRWVPASDFHQYPLSVTGRKLASRVAAMR